MTKVRGALLVAALAVHATLLAAAFSGEGRERVGDERRYARLAVRAAEGAPVRIDPLWPRGPVRWLALAYRGGGGSWWLLAALQTLCLGAVAVVTWDLTFRLTGRAPPADLAAFAVFALPSLAAHGHSFWPEAPHLALLAFAVWIVAARRERVGYAAVLGLCLGLAICLKSLLLPFAPAFLYALARGRGLPGLRRAGLASLTLVIVLAPGAFRTVADHGSAGLGGSSLFNLWVGLNDTSRRPRAEPVAARELLAYRDSADSTEDRQAALGSKVRRLVAERGLLPTLWGQARRQYFRLLDRRSELVDQLPGGLLHQRGRGYRSMSAGTGHALSLLDGALYALLLAAGTVGLVTLASRDRIWVSLVVAFVLYNLALFLLLHVKTRYRVPLLPWLAIFGAAALDRWAQGAAASDHPSQARRIAGGVAAALALFLAFGGPLLGE